MIVFILRKVLKFPGYEVEAAALVKVWFTVFKENSATSSSLSSSLLYLNWFDLAAKIYFREF